MVGVKRILVADDLAKGRELIRTVLERSGYEVFEAVDGQETLDVLPVCDPHLVLLDVQMPVLNGYEVVAAIRQNPAWTGLPVVAITVNDMQGDRERAIAAGFTGYIAKPISLAALRIEIAALLR